MYNPFGFYRPTEHVVIQMNDLRIEFERLAVYILNHVPPSRQRIITMRRLEEAAMWANKGLAHPETYDHDTN